jgi:hypothetical protein
MPRRSRPAAVSGSRSLFCCATTIGGLSLAEPTAAQTAPQIQSIEKQIKAPAAAPPAPPPGPPLPQGAFRVGGLTVTLGGFAPLKGIHRSRNEASSIDTSFNGIPSLSSPNYHIPEFRESA